MPKSPRYRELEIRDKIIKCLQEDDFIKTKIERINLDTKEKDYLYVQDIYPARPPELEKSLYTYVLIMELGLTGNLSY